MHVSAVFRLVALLAATLAVALASCASASAMVIGSESNGLISNSSVTPEIQLAEIQRMHDQGSQLVRSNFGWNEVAGACSGQSPEQLSDHLNPCYNWTILDGLVADASHLNMQILLSITRPPSWASGSTDPSNMGGTEEQFQFLFTHYAAFHTAAATRYAKGSPWGEVHYWTVHNESNSSTFWRPAPSPERYGRLYAATAVAIREANPSAEIAAGPTNPTGNGKLSIPPLDFMKAAQLSIDRYLPGDLEKRRTYIDAWAHNPYPVATARPSISSRNASRRVVGMAHVQRLIDQVDASPLTKGKALWATEFGWETAGPARVTEMQQAFFIAEAYDWLDSLGRFEIGGSYGLTDPVESADLQTGTYHHNDTPKPAAYMMQRMISVPSATVGSNTVAWGKTIRVWGRSNLSPATGKILYSVDGRSWHIVPGQVRDQDGSITAKFHVKQTRIRFAVRDRARGVNGGWGMKRYILTSAKSKEPTSAPLLD